MNSTFSVNASSTILNPAGHDTLKENFFEDVSETKTMKSIPNEQSVEEITVKKENKDPAVVNGTLKKKRKLHNSTKGYFPKVNA